MFTVVVWPLPLEMAILVGISVVNVTVIGLVLVSSTPFTYAVTTTGPAVVLETVAV